MSSSSDDLALKLGVVRGFLLGDNERKKSMKQALELASTCRHLHIALTGVCAGKDVKTQEDVRDVFLAQRR